MAKETNIHFKVDMTVDGKDQVASLGMELGDLETVMKSVEQASKNPQETNIQFNEKYSQC